MVRMGFFIFCSDLFNSRVLENIVLKAAKLMELQGLRKIVSDNILLF